jgi:cell division septation protein DedD
MDNQFKPSFAQRTFRFIRRYFMWVLLLVIVGCSLGFYELGRNAVYSEHPELSGTEQATAILNKVSQLIQLPTGETPSMATINDAASAKKAQPFLASAQNGDVLIVFATAQTALLYRPSSNKLIAVGPVTSPTSVPSTAQTPIPQSPASVPPATSTSSKNATSTKSKN